MRDSKKIEPVERPGDAVPPHGDIVVDAGGVYLMETGQVYISKDQLHAAESWGWRVVYIAGKLVQVGRSKWSRGYAIRSYEDRRTNRRADRH